MIQDRDDSQSKRGSAQSEGTQTIQALEPARGYLKLPNGRALTGQSHDCKRHGTTTLFAALEVATGRIIAAHSKRRRRVEFLGFMNSVLAEKRVDPSNLRAPGQRYAFESVKRRGGLFSWFVFQDGRGSARARREGHMAPPKIGRDFGKCPATRAHSLRRHGHHPGQRRMLAWSVPERRRGGGQCFKSLTRAARSPS